MGIYDVGFGGFGAFKSDYRINNIPKVSDVEKVTPVEPVKSATEAVKVNEYQIEEVDVRPRSVDPNEVSLTFNKGEDFSYIGKDNDINNLDMEKAISDMRQDSILQEYQYFVGNSNNVFQSEDGVVLAK